MPFLDAAASPKARAAGLALLLALACSGPTIAQGPAELRDFRPSSGEGLFDARLDADELVVTLRLSYRFVDGDPELAPGYADAEYKWTPDEQTRFRAEVRRRIEAAWGDRYAFASPGGKRRLAVRLRVVETAPEEAQWRLIVARYPDDAPDTGASACGPGASHYAASCETHREGLAWGTVELGSQHLLADPVLDLELPVVDVWFEPGSDALPDGFLARPAVWLAADSEWTVRLAGYASFDEVAAGATPGETRPTVALARKRTRRVRDALVAQICSPEDGQPADPDCQEQAEARIRIVDQGAYGDSPYPLVQMELHRRPSLDTVTHEAGHMLGLGDEASDDENGAGSPLASADYAALVFWYTGEIVTRHDDEGIMSRGNEVRWWHYVTLLEALEELTGSAEWEIVDR